MTDINISPEMQLSLNDLAMELKSLGLEAAFKDCCNPTEISEYLLNTSWALINLVHCSALGLSERKHSSDREALLLSENKSLESKVEQLRSQVNAQEKLVVKEKGNSLKVEAEQKKLKDTIERQKHEIAELTAKLATQEKNFKRECKKQEEHCEALRKHVRKSISAGMHLQHQVYIERLSSMNLLDRSNEAILQQSTVNRLKTVNCTLVTENLMLRDALKSIYGEISVILNKMEPFEPAGAQGMLVQFTDHIFQLPLVYSMKKLTMLRRQQVQKLYDLIKGSL